MLRSMEDQITVYMDHKNLEYFNTTKIVSRRQHLVTEAHSRKTDAKIATAAKMHGRRKDENKDNDNSK